MRIKYTRNEAASSDDHNSIVFYLIWIQICVCRSVYCTIFHHQAYAHSFLFLFSQITIPYYSSLTTPSTVSKYSSLTPNVIELTTCSFVLLYFLAVLSHTLILKGRMACWMNISLMWKSPNHNVFSFHPISSSHNYIIQEKDDVCRWFSFSISF